jgi:hypothetical protein
MNRIWDCKIKLRMSNTSKKASSPFIQEELTGLVILDENKKYMDIHTNHVVLNRVIKRKIGGKFDHTHVVEIDPLKDLGPSLAKE